MHSTMDTCGLRYVSLSQEFQKHELECRVFSIHCGAYLYWLRCATLFSGPHGLTDKASDVESEDWGFESLCGRLFIFKSCAVFERFF